jgi:hypothetical protein
MDEFNKQKIDILRDLKKDQLSILENVLRNYPKLTTLELLDLIRKENTRRSLPQLRGTEITKQFLLKYVKFDLCDGLGSYEVWKVKRIDVDDDRKQYSLYPDVTVISNVDGIYSIDTYLDEVVIETDSDLKKFTVISKEEYDKEFQNALDYYKSLWEK